MTEPQPRQEEEEESAAIADSAVVHELKNPRDTCSSNANANANASVAPPTKKFKTDDATAASTTDVTATILLSAILKSGKAASLANLALNTARTNGIKSTAAGLVSLADTGTTSTGSVQGESEGKGDNIDTSHDTTIRAKMNRRRCFECGQFSASKLFSGRQWTKTYPTCISCSKEPSINDDDHNNKRKQSEGEVRTSVDDDTGGTTKDTAHPTTMEDETGEPDGNVNE